jgi:SAM-dependent methyltransferase
MDYSFIRYLSAKKTVDDRSLNAYVWETLRRQLPAGPLSILEIGSGTGTMIDRLATRGLPGPGGRYTAIDADPTSTAEAKRRLSAQPFPFDLAIETVDIHDFIRREQGQKTWDLLVAHAVLDLLDISRTLPGLLALLRTGGFFYFTLNFDGVTILEPPLAESFDQQIVALYHQSMDRRTIDGRQAGHSCTGRRLLSEIPMAGGVVLAAGSSDWVVWPGRGGYPADEAYFLHHILHFFETSLASLANLEQARFLDWLARRRAQIEAAELIYIAHQIDLCGQVR